MEFVNKSILFSSAIAKQSFYFMIRWYFVLWAVYPKKYFLHFMKRFKLYSQLSSIVAKLISEVNKIIYFFFENIFLSFTLSSFNLGKIQLWSWWIYLSQKVRLSDFSVNFPFTWGYQNKSTNWIVFFSVLYQPFIFIWWRRLIWNMFFIILI